jgi:hypothetical protein
MRIRRAATIVAAALSLVGCAGGASRANTASTPEEPTMVYFSNNSSEQAAVYAVSGGESRRIGTVFAGQLGKLKVPASMVARGTVNIFARLLARSEQPSSGSISVQPGSSFEVTLMPDRRTMTVLPGRSADY